MLFVWMGFFICAALIVAAGSRLSKYGDAIAAGTGMGRTWIGVALMATVTSLPELATGISSVAYADAPDIAVGDVFGSCAFNILILAFLDAMNKRGPLTASARTGNVLTATMGMLMLIVAAAGLASAGRLPAIGWMGPSSLVIAGLYMVSMRMVYTYERKVVGELAKRADEVLGYGGIPLRRAVKSYALNAAVVAAAALAMPKLAVLIAEDTGLGQSFVGATLVGATTSLPEIVVSIAAVRLGAVDLAIGNLFGSNLFNLMILSIDDALYLKGPILLSVHPSHMVSVLAAAAMTAVAVAGITYSAKRKPLPLGWDSLGIVCIYLLSLGLLYIMRA